MSADPDAILDAVADAIAKPKRVRTDAGETERQSIADVVAAAEFVQRQQAASVSPFARLRHAQAELPGGNR